MTRFLCVGDLHGELPSVPDDAEFDAIVSIGDLCSFELRDEMFAALRARIDEEEDTPWYDRMGRDAALRAIDESVEAGRIVLERLASYGVPVFVIPGNWDWTPHDDEDWDELHVDRYAKLLEPFENVHDIDERAVGFDDAWLVGYGETSSTELPFDRRDEMDEDEWAEKEDEYAELLESYEELVGSCKVPPILVAHAPPYDTRLDAIDRPDSPRHGQHVGSLLVRDLAKRGGIRACVCGHMHENPGSIELDGVPIVNLGFGSEAWCFFDTESGFDGLDRLDAARE